MPNRTEYLRKRIDDARNKIAHLFLDQCKVGQQSKDIGPNVYACGQFLNALNKSQRGMHGTVAALNTIADHNPSQSLDVIKGLTCYLVNKNNLNISREKIEQDYKNIIKISECIIALSKLDSSVAQGTLKCELEKCLQEAMITEKGWGFFVGDKEIEPLPTAFAMIALSCAKSKEYSNRALSYLKGYITSKYLKHNNYSKNTFIDISIDSFCLYAITFREGFNNIPEPKGELGKVFKKIWRLQNQYILNGMEQNIEYYYHDEKTCYVRVPFDLYMIALSSHYEFDSVFSSHAIQKRLNDILNQVLNGGFHYPYAGKNVSSRTNAILFEALSIIKHNMENKTLGTLQSIKDWIRLKWRSKFTTFILVTVMILFIIRMCWSYFTNDSGRLHDIGTELLGSLLAGSIFPTTINRLFAHDRV